MKKFTLLFFVVFAFAFSFQANAQCNYTLEMNDSYGDGWNGNTMDVLVNGTAVLSGVTLASGSQGTLAFLVNDGDDVTTNWIGGGSYAFENSYRILNALNAEVGTGAETSIPAGTITVSCPTCTLAVVDSSTVVDDCVAGTYMVEVEFSVVGDATAVSDGTSVYAISGTSASAGPYAVGSMPTLSVDHSDNSCDFEIGTFASACAPANDECADAEPISCGDTISGSTIAATDSGNNTSNDVWYVLAGTANGEEITASLCGSDYDTYIRVFDACAGTQVAFNDDASGVCSPQSQVTFTSDGATTYYIMVEGYSSNNGNFDLAITCVPPPSCVPATITLANGANNCPTEEFFIDVTVSNLGTGAAVDISDDNGIVETAVGLGTYSVGPYAAGTLVNFTVEDSAGDTCNTTGSFTTLAACPPANDECDNATALTVNPDYSCTVVTSGTNVAASASSQADDVTGTPNNDVWFSFQATNAEHRISLDNIVAVVGTSTDMGMGVYDATSGCSALTLVDDSDPESFDVSGLTIGTTYLVRVYGWYSTISSTTFDICVGTAPSCLQPSSGSAVAITENSADLGWVEAGTATTWNVEWGVTDFTLGTGTLISGTTTNPQPLSGLTALTTYDYYVQADCGGGDLSAWSGPYTFTTSGPIPTNISCATAEAIACGDSITGTTEGSTGTQEDSGCSIGNNGVWYTFTGDGGDLIVTVDADFDHELAITSGTCGALVNIGCDDQSTGQESYTIVDSVDGETYYVYIAHYSNGSTTTGTYKIMLECETMTTDEFDSPNAFTYYPNPVSNVLNVKAQNNISNVAVYNMLGQEVLRTAPNTVASEVDMSNLQTGAYFVKVTIGNATKTIRVIKN
ncbi:T9SS type A sorting domain-containing protein [Bizionia sp.]|uniref:T9SS type A sorting domain-containing protein n=1 Tax=Bizionia sp. TaxID=1954480 RepID=UPI003A9392C1